MYGTQFKLLYCNEGQIAALDVTNYVIIWFFMRFYIRVYFSYSYFVLSKFCKFFWHYDLSDIICEFYYLFPFYTILIFEGGLVCEPGTKLCVMICLINLLKVTFSDNFPTKNKMNKVIF